MKNKIQIYFFIIVAILIIFFMAIPVWGLLQKSQTDSETIESAINRLIAVHESDPEAHLGEGDSLQSHKSYEIIDHVARSIVLDKFMEYQKWDFPFESVNAYIKTVPHNASITPSVQALSFKQSSTVNDVVNMYVGEIYNITLKWAKNPVLQFSMRSGDVFTHDTYILWGANNGFGGSVSGSFGFKINHTTKKIYGNYHLYGASEVNTELVGVDPAKAHFYRAEITGGGTTINFYVDGVLKATASVAGTTQSTDYLFCISQKTFVGESTTTFIWNMSIYQDL